MNLRQMLAEVGILVPNDIPPDIQVSWMNQVQSSLYRFYGSRETAFPFTTQPSVQLYDLPENCIPDRARRLVVSAEEITYIPPDEDDDVFTSSAKLWTIFNNKIFLSPEPTAAMPAVLYYFPSPTKLSLSTIDVEATFPSDFIELVIIGCAIKVAMATNAPNIAVLQMQYETLQQRAERILGSQRQRKVNITRAYIE